MIVWSGASGVPWRSWFDGRAQMSLIGDSFQGDTGAGALGCERALRVLIVDDQPVMTYALQQLLTSRANCEVVGHVATLADARRAAVDARPDVVVLNMMIPDAEGYEFLCWLNQTLRGTRSVVYSVQPASIYARRCLQAGASGYLGKQTSVEDVVKTVRLVAEGHTVVCGSVYDAGMTAFVMSGSVEGIERLSKREIEVLNLLAQGLNSKSIGRCICRSDKTVESHRYRIAKKLNVANGPELVEFARRWKQSGGAEPAVVPLMGAVQ